MEELRDQLKSRGLTHILLSKALREANRELRKWRLEATLKQCQLEIQFGDSVSESVLAEKINEAMEEPSIDLEPTEKEVTLACKKEEKWVGESIVTINKNEDKWVKESTVTIKKEEENITDSHEAVKEIITVNDSADDLQIVESDLLENQERCLGNHDEKPHTGILKNKENVINIEDIDKTEDKDQNCFKEELICDTGKAEDSEEKENVSEKGARKVTFSQNTVSPKATDRTALRANCRRVKVPIPIYIPSE